MSVIELDKDIVKKKRIFLNELGKKLIHLRFVELGDNVNQMKLDEMITLDCLIGAWNSRWIASDTKIKSELNLYFLSLYFDPKSYVNGLRVPRIVREKHKLVLDCEIGE